MQAEPRSNGKQVRFARIIDNDGNEHLPLIASSSRQPSAVPSPIAVLASPSSSQPPPSNTPAPSTMEMGSLCLQRESLSPSASSSPHRTRPRRACTTLPPSTIDTSSTAGRPPPPAFSVSRESRTSATSARTLHRSSSSPCMSDPSPIRLSTSGHATSNSSASSRCDRRTARSTSEHQPTSSTRVLNDMPPSTAPVLHDSFASTAIHDTASSASAPPPTPQPPSSDQRQRFARQRDVLHRL